MVDGLKSRPARRELATATRATAKAGLSAARGFVQGDAEALPLPDEAAEGAICECALC